MAEDHTYKGVGECHPYREFEGMQPSRSMQTSLASATGVSPWVSTLSRMVKKLMRLHACNISAALLAVHNTVSGFGGLRLG